MAGARARKLDVSALLSGSTNIANIITRTGEAEGQGLASLLGGIGSGISRAGANVRDDRARADARAERDEEQRYQRGQDAFRQNLALRADARAEAENRRQEEEQRNKVASEAGMAAETIEMLNRAKAAMATGMPMDPKVLEGIRRNASAVEVAGGPIQIAARAAQQTEPDIDRLVADTAGLVKLSELMGQQMSREKDRVRHGQLADSTQQLAKVIATYKRRIEIHDANEKKAIERKAEAAESDARIAADLDVLGADMENPEYADFTPAQWALAQDYIRKGAPREKALAAVMSEEQVSGRKARELDELDRLRPPQREQTGEEIGTKRGDAEMAERAVTGQETPEQEREREAAEKKGKESARDSLVAARYEWLLTMDKRLPPEDRQYHDKDGNLDAEAAGALLAYLEAEANAK